VGQLASKPENLGLLALDEIFEVIGRVGKRAEDLLVMVIVV
jgi:hypothetical protein